MRFVLVVALLYFQAGGTRGECKPYSKDRCKDLGKQMLRTFSEGTWSTKGCYLYYNKRYGSKIYWSNGGDKDGTKEQIEKEKQEIKQSSKQKRPPGLDCSTVNFVAQSIYNKELAKVCKPGKKIFTEAKCRDAAEELGLRFAKKCNPTDCKNFAGRPGGCFHNEGYNFEGRWNNCAVGKTCVYFNDDTDYEGDKSPAVCEAD